LGNDIPVLPVTTCATWYTCQSLNSTARRCPDAARRWAAGKLICTWLALGVWHWKKVSPGGVFMALGDYCVFQI